MSGRLSFLAQELEKLGFSVELRVEDDKGSLEASTTRRTELLVDQAAKRLVIESAVPIDYTSLDLVLENVRYLAMSSDSSIRLVVVPPRSSRLVIIVRWDGGVIVSTLSGSRYQVGT